MAGQIAWRSLEGAYPRTQNPLFRHLDGCQQGCGRPNLGTLVMTVHNCAEAVANRLGFISRSIQTDPTPFYLLVRNSGSPTKLDF
jgi:hypothetical protein